MAESAGEFLEHSLEELLVVTLLCRSAALHL